MKRYTSTIRTIATFAVLILTPAMYAKPKEKTYNLPPDRLFVLLEKAVHSKFVITFQDKDEMLISLPYRHIVALERHGVQRLSRDGW